MASAKRKVFCPTPVHPSIPSSMSRVRACVRVCVCVCVCVVFGRGTAQVTLPCVWIAGLCAQPPLTHCSKPRERADKFSCFSFFLAFGLQRRGVDPEHFFSRLLDFTLVPSVLVIP